MSERGSKTPKKTSKKKDVVIEPPSPEDSEEQVDQLTGDLEDMQVDQAILLETDKAKKSNGYPESDSTWEYEENVFCRPLITAYWDDKEKFLDNERKEEWRSQPDIMKAKMTARSTKDTLISRENSVQTPSHTHTTSTPASPSRILRERTPAKLKKMRKFARMESSASEAESSEKTKTSEQRIEEQEEIHGHSPDDEFDPVGIEGSWEPLVKEVITVYPTSDQNVLKVYVLW
ncbi:2537_t:CDS:2 [Ambispora gerdemannii]|uniref:2537_t:CDS:1 n=1 Tax=Ambispora gerdemannii TaxID=144530 RepID=A0A9N9BJE9_9GLOM|nr:2537_t:CDS:2 [Ambispora gerdemannii]